VDGWQVPNNLKDQVFYHQPTTADERAEVASVCVLRLDLQMPTLLDTMSDEVDALYAAWPERLYLIDPAGVIAYRSDPGPWGFDVPAWEQAIRRMIEERS
jgi:type I thyroxine 5'-deiodinase